MEKLEILIIDIETTGFSYKADEILEIGIVKLDLLTGRKAKIFDNVFRPTERQTPEKLASSWIIKTGAIKVEEFETAYSLEDFRELIQYMLDVFPLGCTAFNNSFDFGFMEANDFRFPKKLPFPMKLSTDVVKLPGKYKGAYKWPNVNEAYDFFFPGNDYDEIHRGGDDAFHEADIVKKLYDLGIFKID